MNNPDIRIQHRYICVDGPIAVGKTTLCKMLAEYLNARTLLEEFDDNPFLREFYLDPDHVRFQTQVYFLLARFKQQEALGQQDLFSRNLVSDYLFAKDRIFAYLNLSDEELKLYEKIYDLVQPQILKPDLVIYLQAAPEVLMNRLNRRARDIETTVKQDYLEDLMRSYNQFFYHYEDSPILILDTSEADFQHKPEDFEKILRLAAETTEGKHHLTL